MILPGSSGEVFVLCEKRVMGFNVTPMHTQANLMSQGMRVGRLTIANQLA